MEVIQCDKCGVIVDCISAGTSKIRNDKLIYSKQIKDLIYKPKKYDLCATCTKEFEQFMKGAQESAKGK